MDERSSTEDNEFSTTPPSNTHNSRPSHDFCELHPNNSPVISGMPSRASAIFKNSIFNKSNGSFISLKSRSESTSSTVFGPHDIPRVSTTFPKLKCDVCNGSNFECASKTPLLAAIAVSRVLIVVQSSIISDRESASKRKNYLFHRL